MWGVLGGVIVVALWVWRIRHPKSPPVYMSENWMRDHVYREGKKWHHGWWWV